MGDERVYERVEDGEQSRWIDSDEKEGERSPDHQGVARELFGQEPISRKKKIPAGPVPSKDLHAFREEYETNEYPIWDPEKLEGSQIGNVRIFQPIGKGGNAVVYLGVDLVSKNPVAVKVMKLQGSAEEVSIRRRSFLREIAALKRVRHENLLQILSYGQVEKDPRSIYTIVPLHTGGSLLSQTERISKASPQAQIVFMKKIKGILEALSKLWEKARMVHLDVKLENIFLTSTGELILGDLGNVRKITTRDAKKSAFFTGSPFYTSPEQGIESKYRIGPHSDLWSLGVMLYKIFSGREIFDIHHPMYKGEEKDPPGERDTKKYLLQLMAYMEGKEEILDLQVARLEEGLKEIPDPFAKLIMGFLRRKPESRMMQEEGGPIAALETAIREASGEKILPVKKPRGLRETAGSFLGNLLKRTG